MNRKKFAVFVWVFSAAFLLTSCDPPHGEQVTNTWRQVLGLTPADGPYRWFAYPVDNFGVGTFYDPPADRTEWIDSDRICATWSCFDINPDSLNENQRLEINGMADVGGGGSVTLSQQKSRKLGANLGVPVLAKIASLAAGVDLAKSVDVSVTIDRAFKRSINRNKAQEAVGNSDNDTLTSAFAAGKLAYVAADIVATGVQLSLTTKRNVSADTEAKLAEAYKALSADTSLGIKLTSTTDRVATLSIGHPVILAVQTRRQSAGGLLAAGSEADGEVLQIALPRPSL